MYEVLVSNQAENFLKTLDKPQQVRIRDKIRKLVYNPRLGKALVGRLAGSRNLRIDQYRVIYTIRDIELVVLVVKIGRRGSVYG